MFFLQFFEMVATIHLSILLPIVVWIIFWTITLKLGRTIKNTTKNSAYSIIVLGILILPLTVNLLSPLMPEGPLVNKIIKNFNPGEPKPTPEPVTPPEQTPYDLVEGEKNGLPVEKSLELDNVADKIPLLVNKNKGSIPEIFLTGVGIFIIIGSIFFLIKLLLGLNKLFIIKIKSETVADAVLDIFCDVIDELGIRKPILLKKCSSITLPFSFGIRKPIIIIPANLGDVLSENEVQRIKSILTHEIAHIQRNDWLFIIIQRVCECLFFYNPLVWFIGSLLYESQEIVCDSWAIKQRKNWKAYTRDILDYLYREWKVPYVVNTIIHWPGKLKNRVHAARIAGNNVSTITPAKKILVMVLLGLIALLSISFTMGNDSIFFNGTTAHVPLILPETLEVLYSLETQSNPAKTLREFLEKIKLSYGEDLRSMAHQEASAIAVEKLEAALAAFNYEDGTTEQKIAAIHLLLSQLYYQPQAPDEDRYKIAERLLELAKQTNDDLLLASLYRQPVVTGEFDTRKDDLLEARDIYYRIGDFTRLGETSLALGKVYLDDYQYEAAHRCFSSAKKQFDQNKLAFRAAIAGSYRLLAEEVGGKALHHAVMYESRIFSLRVAGDNLYLRDLLEEISFSTDSFKLDNKEDLLNAPFILGLHLKGLFERQQAVGFSYSTHFGDNGEFVEAQIMDNNATLFLNENEYTDLRHIRLNHYEEPDGKVILSRYGDLWFKKGLGLVKFMIVNLENDERSSWELTAVDNLNQDSTSFFPIQENVRWDYSCPELAARGYVSQYSIQAETSFNDLRLMEKRYLFSERVIIFGNEPVLRGRGLALGEISTEHNQYLLYNETRHKYVEHNFNISEEQLANSTAAKLFIRYTHNDQQGYLRTLSLRINNVPPKESFGHCPFDTYYIDRFNCGGFVGAPGQIMSKVFDISNIGYSGDAEQPSYHFNLQEALQSGENTLHTYVPFAKDGDLVTVMLILE